MSLKDYTKPLGTQWNGIIEGGDFNPWSLPTTTNVLLIKPLGYVEKFGIPLNIKNIENENDLMFSYIYIGLVDSSFHVKVENYWITMDLRAVLLTLMLTRKEKYEKKSVPKMHGDCLHHLISLPIFHGTRKSPITNGMKSERS